MTKKFRMLSRSVWAALCGLVLLAPALTSAAVLDPEALDVAPVALPDDISELLSIVPLGDDVETSAVDYTNMLTYTPSGHNGRKIFISPGHTSGSPNSFPCGSSSEYTEAWETGQKLKDYLFSYKFIVMIPKQSPHVSYTTRIDTAKDWGAQVYVNIHSNAHGTTDCGHNGGSHGGTGYVWVTNGNDATAGAKLMDALKPQTPGSAHDGAIDANWRCALPTSDSRYATELCTTNAKALVNAYMEVEFHDTTNGATWLRDNNDASGHYMAHGVLNHFGLPHPSACAPACQ